MTTNRWYRGNIHMHSYWSDGNHFPEMPAAYFKAAGYQFIGYTEHDRFQEGERWLSLSTPGPDGKPLGESAWLAAYEAAFPVERAMRDGQEHVKLQPLEAYRGLLETPEEFLIIQGEEVSTGSAGARHWINVYNAPKPLGPINVDGDIAAAIEAVLARAAELEQASGRPIHVSFNHPNYRWNATAADLAAAPNLHCFEIHTALNSTLCYGDDAHPGAEQMWDDILTRRLTCGGAVLYGLATDDCHSYEAPGGALPEHNRAELPERAWIMVNAPALTANDIVAAIKAGHFYNSSGVMLDDISSDATSLRLRIQTKPGVTYSTQFIGTRRNGRTGELLAAAAGATPEYRFAGDELYVRATVVSDKRHPNPTVPGDVEKAWVQPVVA